MKRNGRIVAKRGQFELDWPEEASNLLHVSVQMVQAYHDWLIARGAALKTINRRVSFRLSHLTGAGVPHTTHRLPFRQQ
jgi:hypothetical protein